MAPDVLAVDEPTNHIDLDARRLLARALHSFPGVGLLVSHDLHFLRRLATVRWRLSPQADHVTMRIGAGARA